MGARLMVKRYHVREREREINHTEEKGRDKKEQFYIQEGVRGASVESVC